MNILLGEIICYGWTEMIFACKQHYLLHEDAFPSQLSVSAIYTIE